MSLINKQWDENTFTNMKKKKTIHISCSFDGKHEIAVNKQWTIFKKE
mgnify:CR=1 FL=1